MKRSTILTLASVAALAFFSAEVASAQSRRAARKAPVIRSVGATTQPLGWRRDGRHETAAHRNVGRRILRPEPRGICQPIHRHGYWKTVCDRVWREGHYRTERVPARYATRYDSCGRPYRVLISPACERRIWVPGRWETVERRVWVSTRCRQCRH